MKPERVLEILLSVARGQASPEQALETLAWLPIEAVQLDGAEGGIARLDHHRALRTGQPEVVFGSGKTSGQVLAICERLQARDGAFLVTRADEALRAALRARFPDVILNATGRIARLSESPPAPQHFKTVTIAAAGTADLAVAEEAAETALAFGNPVERIYDVGVAGLHRLLQETEALRAASILIVVAGMEGALPSVLGGLVRVPVIAVPTSVGYGASFDGLAALLAMLNSCVAGITVVNIDNGFGAACAATRINQLLARTI